MTSTITTLNPLLMDNTEIVKYATSLSFLPLVELNQDLEFVGQLAEEITTEDNRTFTIRLNPDATWSDGVPVTSADGWTLYQNEEVTNALLESQALTDQDEIRARYLLVDQYVQQDVPMISAYILSALGATSNRLLKATPDVFGTFINVHEWDIAG